MVRCLSSSKPRPLPRVLFALAAGLSFAGVTGCGSILSRRPSLPPHPVASIPPLASDEDLLVAIDEYAAVPRSDPARDRFRAALLAALRGRVESALDLGARDGAFGAFEQALGLFAPAERSGDAKRPLVSADLEAMASSVEKTFAREGQELPALVALAVELTLHPDDATLRSKFLAASAWTDQAFVAEHGPAFAGARLAALSDRLSRDWSSPFVVEAASGWYAEREHALGGALRAGTMRDNPSSVLGDEGLVKESYGLARLYVRAGDLAGAAQAADRLASDPLADEPPLRRALDAAAAPSATAADFLSLAHGFDGDRDVALEVCRLGAARFPWDKGPRECEAALAFGLGRIALAARLLEEARRLDPADAELAGTLASVYGQRLQGLTTATDLGRVDDVLARLLDLVDEMHTRFPKQTPDPSPATAYLLAARAYLNSGDLAHGRTLLDRSVEIEPTLDALEQRGQLEQKLGQTSAAVADFAQAAELDEKKPEVHQFEAARMLREQGDAYAEGGDSQRAAVAYKLALADWEQLFGIPLTDQATAEGLVERGRLLYGLGQSGAALQSFDHARDAKPDRIETYIDELSFLVARGHLADVVDIYHQEIGEQGLSDYFRAYTTFWVIDLARLEGQRPDDLALATLDNLAVPTWYGDLARWHAGSESESAVAAKATTPGRRAELYFYQGVAAEAGGRHDEARALWQKVIDTGMVDYLEYDLARAFLAHGAPHGPGRRIDRPAHDEGPGSPAVEPPSHSPDGTI